MAENMIDVVMNPVRLRIVQYLAVHQTGTVREIAAALRDVAKPSIYRHMKALLEADLITVVAEKNVRGTVEKTYAPVSHRAEEYSAAEIGSLFQSALLALMASFDRYFRGESVDVVGDMLSVSETVLWMTDEEYKALLLKIGALCQEALKLEPETGRKQRCLALVSGPYQGGEEK